MLPREPPLPPPLETILLLVPLGITITPGSDIDPTVGSSSPNPLSVIVSVITLSPSVILGPARDVAST